LRWVLVTTTRKLSAADRVRIREGTRWSHCLDSRRYRIYSYNYGGKSSKARSSSSADARTMAEKTKTLWGGKGS
jgi:hypothetical protein